MLSIKKEALALLENQSEQGNIDLFYGDETGVSELAYVPYGWQLQGENLSIAANHGRQLNCFGILSRNNECFSKTTTDSIDADFVVEFFEEFSFTIRRQTVVILDNARIHVAQKVKERMQYWQQRGLFIFYLPPYSPHLNIIERLWKELKSRWLKPEDYSSFDNLKYATRDCLNNVGVNLRINFSKYC